MTVVNIDYFPQNKTEKKEEECLNSVTDEKKEIKVFFIEE